MFECMMFFVLFCSTTTGWMDGYFFFFSFYLLYCSLLFLPPDRVVDDLNPVLNFTRREVESLLHFVEEEPDPFQVRLLPGEIREGVLQRALHLYSHLITKVGEDETLFFFSYDL